MSDREDLCPGCVYGGSKNAPCLINRALCLVKEQQRLFRLEEEIRRLQSLLEANNIDYHDQTTGAE
jgi:hypothetical protein